MRWYSAARELPNCHVSPSFDHCSTTALPPFSSNSGTVFAEERSSRMLGTKRGPMTTALLSSDNPNRMFRKFANVSLLCTSGGRPGAADARRPFLFFRFGARRRMSVRARRRTYAPILLRRRASSRPRIAMIAARSKNLSLISLVMTTPSRIIAVASPWADSSARTSCSPPTSTTRTAAAELHRRERCSDSSTSSWRSR